MNLYHFCAASSMRNIMQEGLTEGMTPSWIIGTHKIVRILEMEMK